MKGGFKLSEIMQNNDAITYINFVHELEKEYEYLRNGGTSYRIKTAEISLEVAKKAGSVLPFLGLESAKESVSTFYDYLDNYRIEDVAKMLNVIAKDLSFNILLSEECKNYIQEKHHTKKPLSFKKIQ